MTENHDTSEFASFFRAMEHSQRTREDRIEQNARPYLESGALPTPGEVRDAINSLVGEKRLKLLRYHKFWKERTVRIGLHSLVHAAHHASMDVSRHDAALGALADSASFQGKVDLAVGHVAQKDVIAYCALAIGVKNTLKEIQKLRDDIADTISEIENNVYSTDIWEFVRKFRNNLLHGRVLVPQWTVSFKGEHRTSTGSMKYSVDELLVSGHWNRQSRSYMQSSSDGKLRLSAVVRDHFALLNDLHSRLDALFVRNMTESERDYWNIEDAHKRGLRRQWAKILVGQIWKGKDPYDQISRFFEPIELREILRYPRNSKKQVDFMIGLKSAEIDWDDELRQLMYRTFGVVRNSAE